MQSKVLFKWLLFILIGVSFPLLLAFFSSPSQDVIEIKDIKQNEPMSFPKEVVVGLPIRLKIPKIKVDAIVEYVGIAPDGLMDTPKGPDNVAWYELGPHPGENGSAVMAGHYGWKDGKMAVFDKLNEMEIGDRVYVEDEKGVTTTFVVREIRNYDPMADATYIFSSNDGKAHLNLITCEGTWNKDQKSYSKRLVVFADKE